MPQALTNVLICEAMGWSWGELMATPAEVVEDVVTLLRKRGLVEEERRRMREAEAKRKRY